MRRLHQGPKELPMWQHSATYLCGQLQHKYSVTKKIMARRPWLHSMLAMNARSVSGMHVTKQPQGPSFFLSFVIGASDILPPDHLTVPVGSLSGGCGQAIRHIDARE